MMVARHGARVVTVIRYLQMKTHEIYQLIRTFYPSQTCSYRTTSIVEHKYVWLKRQIRSAADSFDFDYTWRILHFHDLVTNRLFLNKILYYYECFEYSSMIVYCVSLLICQDKDRFFETLDVFDKLVNSPALYRFVPVSLLFEDYEAFIRKCDNREIMIGDLLSMDDDNGSIQSNAYDHIVTTFVSKDII
eukprot:506213_1